jgi:hypothetical protein
MVTVAKDTMLQMNAISALAALGLLSGTVALGAA